MTVIPAFDTPGPISVDMDLGVGDIRIVASDRADTVVEVLPSDPTKKADVTAAEQTRVEFAAGRLSIKAPKGWKQYAPWRGGESIDVRIALPAGSDIRGEAVVAALRCTGRLGECRYRTSVGDIQIERAGPVQLRTGGGDITVERAADRVEVTTGGGAARINSIDGTAVIKNANGATWVGEITGELQVNAANGSISIDHAEATVSAKTSNGHIRLDEVTRGAVVAETGYGGIEVGVRDGQAAWLDLDTRFGHVRSDLDASRVPEPGEEVVEVRARTSFGDITITRIASDINSKDRT